MTQPPPSTNTTFKKPAPENISIPKKEVTRVSDSLVPVNQMPPIAEQTQTLLARIGERTPVSDELPNCHFLRQKLQEFSTLNKRAAQSFRNTVYEMGPQQSDILAQTD